MPPQPTEKESRWCSETRKGLALLEWTPCSLKQIPPSAPRHHLSHHAYVQDASSRAILCSTLGISHCGKHYQEKHDPADKEISNGSNGLRQTPWHSVRAELAQRVCCCAAIKHSPISTDKHPSLASTKYNNFKDAFWSSVVLLNNLWPWVLWKWAAYTSVLQ